MNIKPLKWKETTDKRKFNNAPPGYRSWDSEPFGEGILTIIVQMVDGGDWTVLFGRQPLGTGGFVTCDAAKQVAEIHFENLVLKVMR